MNFFREQTKDRERDHIGLLFNFGMPSILQSSHFDQSLFRFAKNLLPRADSWCLVSKLSSQPIIDASFPTNRPRENDVSMDTLHPKAHEVSRKLRMGKVLENKDWLKFYLQIGVLNGYSGNQIMGYLKSSLNAINILWSPSLEYLCPGKWEWIQSVLK